MGTQFEKAVEGVLKEVFNLLCTKQSYYGTQFEDIGKILRILYSPKYNPSSGKYELTAEDLDRVFLIARTLDKLCRLACGNLGDESAWMDILGYAVLGEILERNKTNTQSS